MEVSEESVSRSGKDRKRYPRVYARVSGNEQIKIEADAAAHGLTVGAYLRWLALERPETRPVRRPLADVQLLAQIKGQVGKLGGNLHQLVRLANRGEIPWTEDIAIAAKEVSDFLAIARDLLKRTSNDRQRGVTLQHIVLGKTS